MNPLFTLRLALAWTYAAAVSLVGFSLCLVRPFNPGNNPAIARLFAWGGRPLLGIDTVISGREHLMGTTPRVVIANHQSNDDIFLLGDLVPPRGVVIGKSSLRWIPIFGQVFWLGGNVATSRKGNRAARSVLDNTVRALREGRKSVWIFPEGTRSKGRGLLPFKRGAFTAAIAAQAPVVMICTSAYRSKGQQDKPVYIRVLEPISTIGLTMADAPELAAKCHRNMQAVIAELNSAAALSPTDNNHQAHT